MKNSGRRNFLKKSLYSTGLFLLHLMFPKVTVAKAKELAHGREIDWETISCYADVIMPKTELTPSATEVHVMDYLRNVVAGRIPHHKLTNGANQAFEFYLQLQDRLDQLGQAEFSKSFKHLGEEQRTTLVGLISRNLKPSTSIGTAKTTSSSKYSDNDLFRTSRTHVIQGYFADPKYGGNFDYTAWEAIRHTCHFNYPKPQDLCPPHI